MTTQDTNTLNAFTTATQAPDLSKHVNYLLGMVLGVDDFKQEFAYLSNRDHWLARDLLGYGTVCGLGVSCEKVKDKDTYSLQVEPGVALSPSGKFIKVNFTQCADLGRWLSDTNTQTDINKVKEAKAKALEDAKKAALAAALAAVKEGKPALAKKAKADLAKLELDAKKEDGTANSITVYLTLCYRDCLTDPVQIAGEPCRTDTGEENSLLKPSRIQNDFSLNLSLDRAKLPDQTEEDTLRIFVGWLRQFKVAGTSSLTPDEFAAKISVVIKKAQAENDKRTEDKKPPLELLKEILETVDASIVFSTAQVSEFLRAAFRVWVTDLRPWLRGQNANCVTPSQEECVLLAELDLSLTDNLANGGGIKSVVINEEYRPYLLHLRMLQEWMLQKSHSPGDTVVEEKGWGQAKTAGASELFSRVDHTHGTPPNPIPPHQNDPNAHILIGEVTGPISDTRVAEIIGLPVAKELLDEPHIGQVLTLIGNEPHWQAMNLPDLVGEVTGPLNDTLVAKIMGLPVVAPELPKEPLVDQVLRLKKAGERLEWQAVDLPAPAPPVVLNGDVIIDPPGSNRNKIVFLQGKPVKADRPTDKDVLTFKDGAWQPSPAPSGGTDGQFVTRSLKAAYGIVAAGICDFTHPATVSVTPSYNKLDLLLKGNPAAIENELKRNILSFTFTGCKVDKDDFEKPDYIVKLTPWLKEEGGGDVRFMVLFVTYLIKFDKDTKGIYYFTIGFSPLTPRSDFNGRIMIEVSEFTPD